MNIWIMLAGTSWALFGFFMAHFWIFYGADAEHVKDYR